MNSIGGADREVVEVVTWSNALKSGRNSGLVSRWTDLHRRVVQEGREADFRQGRFAQVPFTTI